MNPDTKLVDLIVISAISLLAMIGVISLSVSLFYKTYADPAILTALISITSGLVGSLTTILVNRRTPAQPPPGNGTTAPKP